MSKVNLSRFGVADNRRYKFSNVTASNPNLAKTANKITKVIGLDGGVDENKSGIASMIAGKLSANLWLTVDDPENMAAKKDGLNKITNWGVLPLFYSLPNSSEPIRFCYARCTSISMPENAENCTDRNQVADLTFSVSNPRWYSRDGLFWIGDEWAIIGTDGLEISGSQHDLTFSSISESITLNEGGSALTGIDLVIRSNSATLSDIVISYAVNSSTIEQMTWAGTLLPNEKLEIKSSNLSVIRHLAIGGTENSYSNMTINTGTGFLKKYPEGGILSISGTIIAGSIEVYYNNAWF